MKLNKMGKVGYQRGSVMTEVILVGSLVLVPLFILTPLLGKYIDTRHKVESAARYASWERTAWFAPGSTTLKGFNSYAGSSNTEVYRYESRRKKPGKIKHETQARVLKHRDTPIHSEQGSGADHEELDSLSFFTNRDSNGNASYEPLFASLGGGSNGAGNEYIDLKVNSGDGDGEVLPVKLGRTMNKIGDEIGEHTKFKINTKGMYTSNLELDVKEPKWFKEFSTVDVKFSRDHALLADGWGAGGLKHNEELVKGLTAIDVVMSKDINGLSLGDVFSKFQELAGNDLFTEIMPFTKDIAKDCLVLGKVDADQVPDEVLSADSASSAGEALPECNP